MILQDKMFCGTPKEGGEGRLGKHTMLIRSLLTMRAKELA